VTDPRPAELRLFQPLVTQLRMQTLPMHRRNLCGSRIRFTHCSGDSFPASANDTTGTASVSCCRLTAPPYGRFLHRGPISWAWTQKSSWVTDGR
jgi:hypothetical protein